MNKIKKLAIGLSIILIGTCIVFTSNLSSKVDAKGVKNASISNKLIDTFKDIPIYVIKINNCNQEDIYVLEESSLRDINEAIKDKPINLSASKENNYLHIIKNEYEIIQVQNYSKEEIITNPLYQSTFTSFKQLIDQGTKINYVNIFVKQMPKISSNNNIDDPAYWESNCQYLGTYGGYKFLYLESAANVESSWVTPGNISTSLKWDEITKKSIETIADHYVKGNFYKAVKVAYGALSTLFSSFDVPLSVTYSSSGGYIKAKVSGDLYVRTVLIKDNKDRIPGYAYYSWGTTQQFKAYLKVDAKWPTSKRPGGTYNYNTNTVTYSLQYSNTPGFYGNSTLYTSIISLYENTTGYFRHTESIDINSIIAKILN